MRGAKKMRIAVAGVAAVALVAGSVLALSAAAVASASPSTSCKVTTDDRWQARVQGQPKDIDPHTTAATYMWHDTNGWHIRVTHHTDNRRTFSGQLLTKGTFTDVTPVHLEKNDTFSVSKDKHSITFLFKNYGFIDGLDFHTRCAPSITFAFQSDGKTTPPSHIVIGRDSVHPEHDPFTITRKP
jgi:hypothetical protein